MIRVGMQRHDAFPTIRVIRINVCGCSVMEAAGFYEDKWKAYFDNLKSNRRTVLVSGFDIAFEVNVKEFED